MRKELLIGFGLMAVYLMLKRFADVPNLALGVVLGMAGCFEAIGWLPDKAYNALKRFKNRLLRAGGQAI